MIRTLVLITLIAVLIGCGGGLERIPLSGTVTFNGKPIEDGQIRFMPKEDTKMPLTVEPIKNGEYDTSTTGGVPVGRYQVQFFSYDTRYPEPSGPGAADRPQLLPPSCNYQSKYEIEVESGQRGFTKDFELTGVMVAPTGNWGGGAPPQ
jgi:hypothetical protein